mmetsp:Transcript_110209/g.235312  ORF Transcript_110209/g.235312 Transcript_110209/m.235312 type:complete len:468 (-) Transcript_110209:73-1476(-)
MDQRSSRTENRDAFESIRHSHESGGAFDRGSKGRASRFVKGTAIPKPPNQDSAGLLALFAHPLSLLLLCLPVGVVAYYQRWGHLWIFWLNFFAMIPLAKIMGDATEELAAGLKNDMFAGLLNATFGNAVEMVITINTLRAGLFDVVKATLLGSVLSNLLLVLGMSFFFGGIVGIRASPGGQSRPLGPGGNGQELLAQQEKDDKRSTASTFVNEKVQTFSAMSALVNTSMLLLSCLSFSLVTVFYSITAQSGRSRNRMDEILLPVSRICAVIITGCYIAYIIFQLVTHRHALQEVDDACDEDGDEDPKLSIGAAMGMLAGTTVIVGFCSELLVEALQGITKEASLSVHFIGIVLLPIVGNACEHASAIRFAMMDKPGLSIGIAVGSSTQISLFVVPFSVLVGWMMGLPMDLNFGALNTTVMTLSVIVVLSVVVDGQANWLQGYLLVSAYCVIAVLYWFLPDDLEDGDL